MGSICRPSQGTGSSLEFLQIIEHVRAQVCNDVGKAFYRRIVGLQSHGGTVGDEAFQGVFI